MQIDEENGEVWLVDKPYEWTSFDVVRKLKYALIQKTGNKKIKIGHAGTLDPLATGLLIVCIGKATKKIDQLQAEKKEYTGTIRLGATTASFDRETEINNTFSISEISKSGIEKTAQSFLGEQQQTAPVYSAKKVEGVRAYQHARSGTETELKSHSITIFEFEITSIQLPDVYFRITCSKGTYIRSIANDFGKRLNNGAFLYDLRRTKSGDFSVENASQLDALIKSLTGEETDLKSKRGFLLENRKK